jgi:hypothetical protein
VGLLNVFGVGQLLLASLACEGELRASLSSAGGKSGATIPTRSGMENGIEAFGSTHEFQWIGQGGLEGTCEIIFCHNNIVKYSLLLHDLKNILNLVWYL